VHSLSDLSRERAQSLAPAVVPRKPATGNDLVTPLLKQQIEEFIAEVYGVEDKY